MMDAFASLRPPQVFRLVCRPALPKDTLDVLELTKHIWDGHDYIPFVWQDWLRDPQGLLVVAEFGGRVVGISKLTRLSPHEWWLEGLRVHPQYEGRGIASHMNDYILDYWKRVGSGVVRLGTSSIRKPVHHLCERSGFRKIFECTSYRAAAESGSIERFSALKRGDEADALAFIQRNPSPTIPAGLMDTGWQWHAPSLDELEKAVSQTWAWWWGEDQRGALLLVNEDDEDGLRQLRVQLLAGPWQYLPACLQDFRHLAAALGYGQVSWFAPLHPQVEALLLEAGFSREWDDALFVYEKEHIS